MKKLYIALFLLLYALCLFFFILLRGTDSKGHWKSYAVLAVSTDVPAAFVVNELEKTGISGIISINEPFLDLFPSYVPIESLFSKETSLFFFSDKEQTHFLYYIPRTYTSLLVSSRNKGILPFTFTLDSEQKLPKTVFLSCLILFLLLLFFAEYRTFFTVSAVPILVYSWCFPSLSMLPLLMSLLLMYFFIQKKHRRSEILYSFIQNKRMVFLCLFILIVLFFLPLKVLISFPLLPVCSVFGICAFRFISAEYAQKRRFNPVPILSARYEKDTRFSFFIYFCSIVLICINILLLLIFSSMSSLNMKSLSIPSPVKGVSSISFSYKDYSDCIDKSVDYPSLALYITDCWNSCIIPYRKVSESSSQVTCIPENSEAIIQRYKSSDGVITPYFETLYVFDNTFIGSILSAVEKSRASGIQKVLLSEKCFSPVAYSPVTAYADQNTWIGILIISCIFFLMLILFTYKKPVYNTAFMRKLMHRNTVYKRVHS